MESHLHIREAADLLGLTPKALRHYEKLGLIKPARSENDYRIYTAEHVLRLLRIRRLQSLGLSLSQIRTALKQADNGEFWQSVLQSALEDVDAQIEALETRREELERLLENEPADALAIPIDVPQRAQDYLERHLTAPQASLRASYTNRFHAPPDLAIQQHLVLLAYRLARPTVRAVSRYRIPEQFPYTVMEHDR